MRNQGGFFSGMVVTAALAVLCGQWVIASELPNSEAHYKDEKRSIICNATGYACVGPEVSEAEGMERAVAVARHFAVQKCHEILEQKLSMVEGRFDFELLAHQPGQLVKVMAQEPVKAPISGPLKAYGVRITGELRYRFLDSHQHDRLMTDSRLPLTVRAWSGQQLYRKGENVVFYIRGNKDYYARIIDVAPGGEMIQILPNLFRQSHFFGGGLTYRFPDPGLGDDFELTVEPPYGTETVIVFASEMPVGDVAFSQYIGQFGVIEGKTSDVEQSVRQILPRLKEMADEGGPFSHVEFYESRWTLKTAE